MIDLDLSRERFKLLRKGIIADAKALIKSAGITPKLVIIANHEDEASKVYIKNKLKTCEEVGIETYVGYIDARQTLKEVREMILYYAGMEEVTGVIIQLPLPKRLKQYQQELIDLIPWYKDVDGLSTESIGRLWAGKPCLEPATALGVSKLLPYDLAGVKVSIINRSALIGKPLAKILLDRNASVELLHSKSDGYNIGMAFKYSDVVITGVGVTGLTYWYDGGYWIDCGIIRRKDGTICGDAGDVKSYKISPVPHGVGTLTTACLAINVVRALTWQKR